MFIWSLILVSFVIINDLSFSREFPIRLENPHVVSSNQVWVGVVPTGPSGGLLNSSFKNRDCLEYKQELGNAIGRYMFLKCWLPKYFRILTYFVISLLLFTVNFSRIVPDGLLVFFPSYYLMDQCIECWKKMVQIEQL